MLHPCHAHGIGTGDIVANGITNGAVVRMRRQALPSVQEEPARDDE